METNKFPPLPEQREIIHDLTIRKHTTGLSPPEEDILSNMEASENYSKLGSGNSDPGISNKEGISL